MGTVYIVHCIDTEGPLYQSHKVPFEQIKKIFGLNIEPTEDNLVALQEGTLDLGALGKPIQNLVDPLKNNTLGSWENIEKELELVTSDEFRNKLLDSNGNGWIYSWFCMDHVGFFGENPRRRDLGHHKIYDYYKKLVEKQKKEDIVQFHHHPVSVSGNCNESGTAFWGKSTLDEILTRKIIERKWFPTVFRPGFHTERPDSNWFLEQWIPFDYGNQAVNESNEEQEDLAKGRFGDWRHATCEWIPYHPSHDNYQVKGNCRRWITRCLNMHARIRELTLADVEDAFISAKDGENVILSFTDHDYKNMEFEVEKVRKKIEIVSNKYPDIRFEYVNALEGMRKCLDINKELIGLHAEIVKEKEHIYLHVKADSNIFGPQPYLAIKTKEGKYFWDNFDFYKKKQWTYTFDCNTIDFSEVDNIGIATNNLSGVCEIMNYDINTGWKKNVLGY